MEQLISVYLDTKKQLHIDISDDLLPWAEIDLLGRTVKVLRARAEAIKAEQGNPS